MASTPNVLTGLIPIIYTSLDIVARELVGMINAVNINASLERVAKDETITVPITPTAATPGDIAPNVYPPDDGNQTIGYMSFTIDKSKYSPIMWNGEQQQAIMNQNDWAANGKLADIVQKQIVQSMRALCNMIETDLCTSAKYMSRAVGTAATTPFSSSTAIMASCRRVMNENGAPQSPAPGDYSLIINSAAAEQMRSLGILIQNYAAGTTETLRNGTLLPLTGFDIKESAQVIAHTKGGGTSYVIDKTGSSFAVGSTTITLKSGSGTILAGDVVTFAGDTNKYLVTTGNTTNGDIIIAKPGLKIAAADGVAMTIGDSANAMNPFFHRDAIQLVARAPIMPVEGDQAAFVREVQDPVSGLPFQFALYKLYREIKFEVGMAWNSVGVTKPEFTGVLLG
jgi:hypothetical protein